jgi:hypothetical protein
MEKRDRIMMDVFEGFPKEAMDDVEDVLVKLILRTRINTLYHAIQQVEECGAHPFLTDAVVKLNERMKVFREELLKLER